MGAGSASNFLRLLNQQNADIAARAAEEETQKEENVDQFRIQKDKERRERLGQLRAREHPSKRPVRAYGSVFGFVDPRD